MTETKGKSKMKISKKKMKLVNKYCVASVPVISFGKGMEFLEQMATRTLIRLAEEQDCIQNHLNAKDGDEAILSHLYNTNMTMTELVYFIGWLFHNQGHLKDGTEHLNEIKDKATTVDKKLSEYEPFLNHICKVVKDAKEREVRGKEIYG